MKKILTNGCFDILHEGHLHLLRECKKLGDSLVIALNSDKSIKNLKGNSRPYNDLDKRIQNLYKTGLIHSVCWFDDEEGLEQIIKDYKPDILVKGSEYKSSKITGADIIQSYGGKIYFVDELPNYSTTNILNLQSKGILITGVLGFIGSNVLQFLSDLGVKGTVCVDKLDESDKWKYLLDKEYLEFITVKDLKELISDKNGHEYISNFDIIIHLGANTNTQESDMNALYNSNIKFTNRLIQLAVVSGKKIIYASSSATYGNETNNFTERITDIYPETGYAYSKLSSDIYLNTIINYGFNSEFSGYGLRFFNVYGNNENHKVRMESAITKLFKFDKEHPNNSSYPFELFESNDPNINHGEQSRDFIHVQDVCKVILHFMLTNPPSGIYNLGSGRSTTFNEICSKINPHRSISYINNPIKGYQNYTCADLTKLREVAKYTSPFLTIAEGIKLYK